MTTNLNAIKLNAEQIEIADLMFLKQLKDINLCGYRKRFFKIKGLILKLIFYGLSRVAIFSICMDAKLFGMRRL